MLFLNSRYKEVSENENDMEMYDIVHMRDRNG